MQGVSFAKCVVSGFVAVSPISMPHASLGAAAAAAAATLIVLHISRA